jgi:hypothetical protein
MGCSSSKSQKVDEPKMAGPAGAKAKQQDQLALPSPPAMIGGDKVKVHVGPLEVGTDGVVMKPKFNLGIQGGSIYAMAGVRDVRDGIAGEALGMAMKAYSAQGISLAHVLQSVKAEEPVPALDDIIKLVPDISASVMDSIGVDIASGAAKVEGIVYVYVGAGVSAGLFLGWLDTKGYRMVGIEGRIAAAASMGLTVKAGLHENKQAVRITVYLTNVGFDVVVTLQNKVSGAS